MTRSVLCVGEVLWDAMPDGLFLGGAPFNVAHHLRQSGVPAALASRIGDDELGREALRRVQRAGVEARHVQTDPDLPTGFVRVEVDDSGSPTYEIVEPVAWDALDLSGALRQSAENARAVVFGSLAQRREASRATIRALVDAAPLAVFDVNLRPPFVDRDVVHASLEAADWVKLNDDELAEMTAWFGLADAPREAVGALAERFGCALVCVTRGGDGAVLWHEGRWTEHSGYRVTVADTVGAGDAFLAGLLAALFDGNEDAEALDRAARLGAFVASRSGATPEHEASALRALSPRR